MLQAAVCDGVALDAFSFGEDRLSPVEVGIGRREVVDALVIADVIVVFDEGSYLPFEIAGQVVVVKQNAVLQGLVPALDLSLGLGLIRSAADVLHALVSSWPDRLPRNSSHCRLETRPMCDGGRDIGGSHRGTKPPSDDVAREVIEHGREIVPTPSGDLEAGEVGQELSPNLGDDRAGQTAAILG